MAYDFTYLYIPFHSFYSSRIFLNSNKFRSSMSMADIHVLLSHYSMTEDLNPNPTTELQKIVNDLRIKYRTYVVDLDVQYGMVVLPTLFVHDFGDELGRYARLVDRNYNEFEVLVERSNGRIYLTTGWHALKDFFNVPLGSWVSIVYVSRGKFGIYLKDRFEGKIPTPKFNPPMKFELERQMLPFHEFDVLPSPKDRFAGVFTVCVI